MIPAGRRVLFVCTGNICRSPAAEAIARGLAESHGLLGWTFDSAGTYPGHAGEEAQPHSRALCTRLGFPITHRARGLRKTDGAQFDLLIGLAQEHVRQLKGHFPEQAGKVSLMRDWDPASVGLDVEDPYGEPYASYEEMGRVLIPAIRGLLGLGPSSSSDGGSRRP